MRKRWGLLPASAVALIPLSLGSAPLEAAVAVAREQIHAATALLPRGFVANHGQWDAQAAFAATGFYGSTWVTTSGELRHVLVAEGECETTGRERLEKLGGERICPSRAWVVSERLVGGEVKALTPEEELPGKVSYFVGSDPHKYRPALLSYRSLDLGEVYPGVWVRLSAGQRTVEKVFLVESGGDPSRISIELRGAESLQVDDAGELVVRTGYGNVVMSRPVAWQEVGGIRHDVEVSYRLDRERSRYGFALGRFAGDRPLWIDPVLQSTYLGGSSKDLPYALAVHPASGEVYVAGRTESVDFPNTAGGAQPSTGGGTYDAFVARLNASLTTNLQSTHLGGSQEDFATALAIHPTTGEVYVAGPTGSPNFPNTAGGAQPSKRPNWDAFVARLDPSLTSNPQSTYLGGSQTDYPSSLTIHGGTGEVYVAGSTNSDDFPHTAGGAQASGGGGGDAFVARLSAPLTANPQSTYLGGTSNDGLAVLAIHPTTGEVYVAGSTDSTDFPHTVGGAQEGKADLVDAFVARLNGPLTANPQSTYLGGNSLDDPQSLAIHPMTGEVYVAGSTKSTDFPSTIAGAQASNGGSWDAFVVRLGATLANSLQSTYLGGPGDDRGLTVAIHSASGDVYLAGWTDSVEFPNTAGGAQASNAGVHDAYVARLNAGLTANPQSTFLGGSEDDYQSNLSIHPTSGEVYVAGGSSSNDFPKTAGGAQATKAGDYDAYVARLSSGLASSSNGDMVAKGGAVPPSFGPGVVLSGLSFSCSNGGPDSAVRATCAVSVSAGAVSGVSCSRPVPVDMLPAGATIDCTFTFTAPGTQDGGDTPETGVTFTFTTSADNDGNPSNNAATSGPTPIPIVDALNDAGSFPAGTLGATLNVGANDQYGTGSLPVGAVFSVLVRSTCSRASIGPTGIATFDVPASQTCKVEYSVCVNTSACDTAQLVAAVQQAEAIPTLDGWGLSVLVLLVAAVGFMLARRPVP